MTDDDLPIAIDLVATRLRQHGRRMLAPDGCFLSEALMVDGQPVILHYSPHETNVVVTYPIDKSLTLGQFIDGFNTTMTMLYGQPAPSDRVTIHAKSRAGAQVSQYANPSHVHAIGAGQVIGGPLDANLTFLGKSYADLTDGDKRVLDNYILNLPPSDRPRMMERLKSIFK